MGQPLQRIRPITGPFIDGRIAQSASETTFDSINPSNGQPGAAVPAGDARDVDPAVASARRAFDAGGWSLAPAVRKRALHAFADLVAAAGPELDALDAADMGKPVSVALFNAAAAAGLVRFYAEAVDKVMGDVYGSGANSLVAQRRVPRGVVAAIVPWNFPTYNAVLKVAPAMAAGNAVVLKPSELASRSAMRLAELALEAGVPPGVFNLVPGLGRTVGQALALHDDVDMLSFTGSTAVGKQLLVWSGQSNMKLVVAECGGKSPQILFADSDIETASEAVARSILTNQGQICSVGSRLLVERSIESLVLDTIARRFGAVAIGDALDPATTFGPLVSATQAARVINYIETGPADGAELVTGGAAALPGSGGHFVEPTLFRAVSPTSRLAQEEIFGPVLAATTFEDAAEAIRLANSTRYGLMAYVWTKSLTTGMQMVKAIRSSVLVNAAAPSGEGPGHAFSFEPYGQSGIGVEGGLAGMESYLRRQLVWINHA